MLTSEARKRYGYKGSLIRNNVSSHTFAESISARDLDEMRRSTRSSDTKNAFVTSRNGAIVFSVLTADTTNGTGPTEATRKRRRGADAGVPSDDHTGTTSSTETANRAVQAAQRQLPAQGALSGPSEAMWERTRCAIRGLVDVHAINGASVFQSIVVNVRGQNVPSNGKIGGGVGVLVCIAVRLLGGVSISMSDLVDAIGCHPLQHAVFHATEQCSTAANTSLGYSAAGEVAREGGIGSLIVEFVVGEEE